MAVVGMNWSAGAEMSRCSASGSSHCVSAGRGLRAVVRVGTGRIAFFRGEGVASRSSSKARFPHAGWSQHELRTGEILVSSNVVFRQHAGRRVKGFSAAGRWKAVSGGAVASTITQDTSEFAEAEKEQSTGKSSSPVAASSLTRTAGDSAADESQLGFPFGTFVYAAREGKTVACSSENPWRLFEVGTLVRGPVGRYAMIGAMLLGVGWLATAGEAEAATAQMAEHRIAAGWDAVDMRALALGPEGPLVEEFWENLRRYGLYFVTVVSGGIYSLVRPAVDALRNPLSAVLVVIIVVGSVYLVGLTVSAMLGISEFQYDYAL